MNPEAKKIRNRVIDVIHQSNEFSNIVNILSTASDGDIYIMGGFVRDSVFGEGSNIVDLDVFVSNDNRDVFDFLDTQRTPFEYNRHGIRKYNFDGLYVEICTPELFHRGFATVVEAIGFIDLKIHAIGIHLGTEHVLDPIGGIASLVKKEVGLNIDRWEYPELPQDEQYILLIRLVKILEKYPWLKISDKEIALAKKILSTFKAEMWEKFSYRYKNGFIEFNQSANRLFG